eukprot:CAMPEP_0194535998 /NCGR_PEP_ID=MMETSP0253-20130528/74767_1 /TAXON_ID=2966 /ORGANISM="Noctiluca scintillans" /LENGTH=61 /DNA_ID=CAMNT_0039381861 /DNA_START=168 /DNA_END=354 /DNA_ORIENTATION=-
MSCEGVGSTAAPFHFSVWEESAKEQAQDRASSELQGPTRPATAAFDPPRQEEEPRLQRGLC